MSVPGGVSVRLGVVVKVGRTFVDFHFLDSLDNQVYRTPIPQPYAGRGGGVLVGIEKDAIILVTNGPGEKWYTLAVIPDHNFYFDLDGAQDIKVHESMYPTVKEGEICLKSNQGSRLDMLNNGNIRMNVGASDSLSDFELSRLSNALFTRVDNEYSFTESGRLISGVVRRHMNPITNDADEKTLNYLDSERYDLLLKAIGRFPKNSTHFSTTTAVKEALRNPSLVENRQIIYEYANSFNVLDFKKELANTQKRKKSDGSIDESVDLRVDRILRPNRRTDVLNLNLENYNHLIEKVEGTLVDIYGNILDLNRSIINVPDITEMKFSGNDTEGLRRVYDHHRRGIKLHYEINSRKDITDTNPPDSDKTKDNAKSFSRWSIDVDGEGQTKINIPASSETGNIPVLGRFINQEFQNEDRRDIKVQPFGVGGQSIENDNYDPVTEGNSAAAIGTAHHNLMFIAQSVFESGQLAGNGTLPVSSNGPMEFTINNTINESGGPSDSANAGGRSLQINLDGSMEMSVGADTVDKKSILLDTQGGVISHFGRDKNGRSLIHQTDGDVIIQIGGSGTDSTDSRFNDTENRPGRIEIHLNRGDGTPQKILIDENGMTIDIHGNMVFNSSGDMALKAGGSLLLHGELIYLYGSVDVENRLVQGSETLVVRAGSPQFT